jgi:hypothetical protein
MSLSCSLSWWTASLLVGTTLTHRAMYRCDEKIRRGGTTVRKRSGQGTTSARTAQRGAEETLLVGGTNKIICDLVQWREKTKSLCAERRNARGEACVGQAQLDSASAAHCAQCGVDHSSLLLFVCQARRWHRGRRLRVPPPLSLSLSLSLLYSFSFFIIIFIK